MASGWRSTEESDWRVLYKIIGESTSPAKDLANNWMDVYNHLDRADIRLSLPASLLPAFRDLQLPNVELKANSNQYEGEATDRPETPYYFHVRPPPPSM